MYALTIIHQSKIVFLDIGFTPGSVLTKASVFVNELVNVSTTCNNVEQFLESHPDFSYLLKSVSQY